MTMFDFRTSTISQMRSGEVGDEWIFISESKKVINQKILLSEIPAYKNKVSISGLSEVQSVATTGLATGTYFVNYSTGVIDFPSTSEGVTYVCSYMGRGNIFISSDRVWTQTNENLDVVQTLEDIIGAGVGSWSFKGEWNNATSYVANNVIVYSGTAYVALVDNTNIIPTNSLYWTPFFGLDTGAGANQIPKRDQYGNLQNIGHKITSVSANTTLTYTQSGMIHVTTGSNDIVITLPDASTEQVEYTIKKIDSGTGTVTISTTNSQTIEGTTSRALSTQYESVTLVSGASNWLIYIHNFVGLFNYLGYMPIDGGDFVDGNTSGTLVDGGTY